MKFPSAVTAAGNAIRKLHRQSDQTEIIVCGEFIIHVKHDYALHRAETLVSVSPTGMRTGAKCATQSSLKKLADAKLNATSSCLRTVSRARAFYCTLRSVRLITSHYPFPVRLTLLPFSIPILYYSEVSCAASSSVAKEKRHYTGRFVEARP